MNKKIITAMSALLMSFVLSGVVFASEKSFSSIEELSLKGVDFRIEKADAASVSITGDENSVIMQNEAGYLYIEATSPVQVVVRTPYLDSLVLADKSEGTITGSFEVDALSLNLTGSSKLNIAGTVKAEAINVHAGNNSVLSATVDSKVLNYVATSKANVSLKGETRKLNAALNMGYVNFDGLNVQQADIAAAGSAVVDAQFPGNSDTKVTVEGSSAVNLDMNGLLSARATGDGQLSYTGNIEWVGKYQSNNDDDDAVIRRM